MFVEIKVCRFWNPEALPKYSVIPENIQSLYKKILQFSATIAGFILRLLIGISFSLTITEP